MSRVMLTETDIGGAKASEEASVESHPRRHESRPMGFRVYTTALTAKVLIDHMSRLVEDRPRDLPDPDILKVNRH